MEARPTACGVSLPMQSPQQSRKGWRAVSDHHSVRNVEEKLEQVNLGKSDERTIDERGREPLGVDLCSITIDENLNNDILEQRFHDVATQKLQLQQMEIELRAHIIARSKILELQKSFDAQLKKHTDAAVKLQEQLHEREQSFHELQRTIEDKDRELHAIKLDKEAAWAQENLLREQYKELATYRRERDHSEAERSQTMKQIHDLQEHVQEKESQLLELQEQHRIAQETILYRDEQLREAQAWIVRVQEMDAMQSATNQSLQAELRERTEQYNQLWLGCQRQFTEMERFHIHTVQQLQLELADASERSGSYKDESHASQRNSKDVSQCTKTNGNQPDSDGDAVSSTNTVLLSNGNPENIRSLASTIIAPSQTDHVAGVPIAPSLLGMPTYIPPGQITALHPFFMNQGIHQSVSSVSQSHVGNLPSIPTISSVQQCPSEQAVLEGSKVDTEVNIQLSKDDQIVARSDMEYNYEISGTGQPLHPDYLKARISQRTESDRTQVESIDKGYPVNSQPEHGQQQRFPHSDALSIDPHQLNGETKAQGHSVVTSSNDGQEGPVLNRQQSISPVSTLSSDNSSIHSVSLSNTTTNRDPGAVLPDTIVSAAQTSLPISSSLETSLLDERALLASIVRTIPTGGRIRISSTLPNRLGKMLAPLHWHDYKKKYGKLEEFVAGHPKLFVIEGDYIQLRDGAQEMIAATAAVAKVAAAAAASSPYSTYMPSVAVTPMAQPHRLKKNQQQNGAYLGVCEDMSNVKLLKKSNDYRELNGLENKPCQSFVPIKDGNVARTHDRSSSVSSNQSSNSANGRPSFVFAGKQKGR